MGSKIYESTGLATESSAVGAASKVVLSVLLSIALPGLSGCSWFSEPDRTSKLGEKTSLVSFDATRRAVVVTQDKDGRTIVYSEPSPDVAMESVTSFVTNLQIPDGLDAKLRVDLADKIIQLGKRGSAIMFLRESLYRLSELASNGAFEDSVDINDVERYIEQAYNPISRWNPPVPTRKSSSAAAAFMKVLEAASNLGMADASQAATARLIAIQDRIKNAATQDEAEKLIQAAVGLTQGGSTLDNRLERIEALVEMGSNRVTLAAVSDENEALEFIKKQIEDNSKRIKDLEEKNKELEARNKELIDKVPAAASPEQVPGRPFDGDGKTSGGSAEKKGENK